MHNHLGETIYAYRIPVQSWDMERGSLTPKGLDFSRAELLGTDVDAHKISVPSEDRKTTILLMTAREANLGFGFGDGITATPG